MKDIEGMITFTYYNDIENATEFYRETLGFTEVMNREWVKIFKVGKDSHIGLVNAEKGYLKPQAEKPVMLSVFVEDVDAWYRMLEEKGVKTNHPPQKGADIAIVSRSLPSARAKMPHPNWATKSMRPRNPIAP